MARLFFALWPDALARDRLGALALDVAQASRGKPVPAANLHLTIAFLGEVNDARVDLLSGIAAGIEAPAFRMELDRVGSFARARVAWAGCARPDPRLMDLQAAIATGLDRQGFTLEDRPFAPHLTLARKAIVALPPRRIEPIGWQVGEFALVSSRAGRYETEASWRLG